MAEVAKQWDTDWFDKFKQILPTQFNTMALYPGNPLYWVNRVGLAFGQKQAQRNLRKPDQRVNISKDIEFIDKYAKSLPQVADMPALTDALRVDSEFYAGDTVNALGHVSDLTENFLAALVDFAIIGTGVSPLAYGLLDDPGTGSTTASRPMMPTAVSTAGYWDVATVIPEDVGRMEYGLDMAGHTGPKILATHPIVKPYLDMVFTNTAAPVMRDWISSYKGYPVIFHPSFDADATTSAADVYMIDTSGFDLFTTPLRMNAFYDNNQEDYVWHWSTRAYLLARPKHDGTDYSKGIIKCTVDCTT